MALDLKVHCGGESLKQDILTQIKKRALKKNDRILPEEKLAELYGLGIKTVRNALSELEAEGIIYRKKRIGTFVKKNLSVKSNIAVLIFDILDTANPYCREILRGINSFIDNEKCSIQIHPVQSRRIKGASESLLQKLVYSGEIDGLLVLSWLDIEEIREFIKCSIPFVLAGFEYKEINTPNVIPDLEGAFSKMLNYLAGQGHKNIALIAGHLDVPDTNVLMAENRLDKIYRENTKSDSLNLSLTRGMYTVEDGRRIMNDLLDNPEGIPDAVISHGNELTKGALDSIVRRGLQPGKDILLVGYVEDPLDFPRPLIRNPIFETGRKSAELLMEQINSDALIIQKELIEPEFIFI